MVVPSNPVPIPGGRSRAPRFSRMRMDPAAVSGDSFQPPPSLVQQVPPPGPLSSQGIAFEDPYHFLARMGTQFLPAPGMGYVNAPLFPLPPVVFTGYPPLGYSAFPPYPMPLFSSPAHMPPAGFGFSGFQLGGNGYGIPPPPYSDNNLAYYGTPQESGVTPWSHRPQGSPPPSYEENWQHMPPPPQGSMASPPMNHQDSTTDFTLTMIIPMDHSYTAQWCQDGITYPTQNTTVNVFGGANSSAGQAGGSTLVSLSEGATSDNCDRRPSTATRSSQRENPVRFCVFCKTNRETRAWYESHVLKTDEGIICCPILRKYTCTICCATGDNAHTLKYCPENPDSLLNRPRSMSLTSERSFRQRRKRNSRGVIGKYKYERL